MSSRTGSQLQRLHASETRGGDINLLPDDIMEVVLARLPFLNLAQSHLVCKRWNELVMFPSFAKAWKTYHSAGEKWMLFYNADKPERGLSGYNLSLNEWHILDLGFLPQQFKVFPSTAGGLLCATAGPFRSEVWVCNPVTRQAKRLPPTLLHRTDVEVQIMQADDTNSYTVLASSYSFADCDSDNGDNADKDKPLSKATSWTSELYESRTGEWISIQNPLGNLGPRPSGQEDGVLCFFPNSLKPQYASGQLVGPVVSRLNFFYNDRLWSNLILSKRLLSTLREGCPWLLEGESVMMMVGGLSEGYSYNFHGELGITVATFDLHTQMWKEVARMPKLMFEGLKITGVASGFQIRCFVHTKQIYFFGNSLDLVVYDFFQGTDKGVWHNLPSPSLTVYEGHLLRLLGQQELCGVYLEPSLDILL